MADDAGRRGWFDWLPWRTKEPEPEPLLILGMDPLVALCALVAIVAIAVALYHRPRAFMTGFSMMVGNTVGFFVGIIAIGGLVVAGATVIFDLSAAVMLAILAVVVLIALVGFFAGGGF